MSPTELQNLLDQYITEKISEADYRRLWATLQDPEYAGYWHDLMADAWNNDQPVVDPRRAEVLGRLKVLVADENDATTPVASVHRIYFLKTAWFRYAAVLLLVLGTGVYFFFNRQERSVKVVARTARSLHEIAPGGNRAVLTLADGTTIILDSAANGKLAEQGNTKILKLDGGSLAYNAGGSAALPATGGLLYNTINTPKGGQYQITLPDGSKVWLNALSSIRFPTSFSDQRTVNITGEAYFEIAPDKSKPFSVLVNGMKVNVLGTSFNINAYADESNLTTTLISGSVNIEQNADHALLKPGQQAMTGRSGGDISVLNNANIAKALAWKNGEFNFEDASLQEIMKQLARWYDIDVIYEPGIPATKFGGKMSKDIPLGGLLKGLEKTGGIHFRLEAGRRLVVSS